ncbi:hypothetical protein [Stenotrophomonas rhizophila]
MNRDRISPVDADEWAAQEQGRLHAGDAADARTSAVSADYRQIAMALKSLPRSAPPPDFTAAVLRQVTVHEAEVEKRLVPALIAVLVALTAGMVLLFGRYWWQLVQLHVGHDGIRWAVALAACMLASRLCRRWLRRPAPTMADALHRHA